MLVAPAGYGKTVLASEWSAEQGRTPVWCQVRSQHVDVAALAVEVARRADAVAPGCGRRLRERLATAQEPAVDARVAAEMLAEDFVEWPADAWLVLDDYHHLIGAEDAELFVRELVDGATDQAARDHARAAFVGDDTRPHLRRRVRARPGGACDDTRRGRHARRPAGGGAGRLDRSRGRLAGRDRARTSSPEPSRPLGWVSDEIYDFFAEEVYPVAGADVRRALSFALAPSLDRELAAALVGPDAVDSVIREAEIGLTAPRSGQIFCTRSRRHFCSGAGPTSAPSGRSPLNVAWTITGPVALGIRCSMSFFAKTSLRSCMMR